jgi:uncharacterized protein YjiS (DUF1127 family)
VSAISRPSRIDEKAVMMDSLHGERQPSSPTHYHDKTRRAVRRQGVAVDVRTLEPTARRERLPWMSLDVRRTRWVPHRAKTRGIAPLTAIRRLVLTFQEWRRRARSRQELSKLSDHMLKDIGLSREAADREAAKPFWR